MIWPASLPTSRPRTPHPAQTQPKPIPTRPKLAPVGPTPPATAGNGQFCTVVWLTTPTDRPVLADDYHELPVVEGPGHVDSTTLRVPDALHLHVNLSKPARRQWLIQQKVSGHAVTWLLQAHSGPARPPALRATGVYAEPQFPRTEPSVLCHFGWPGRVVARQVRIGLLKAGDRMNKFWTLCGMLSPGFYVGSVIAGGALRPGYSHVRDPISSLSAHANLGSTTSAGPRRIGRRMNRIRALFGIQGRIAHPL